MAKPMETPFVSLGAICIVPELNTTRQTGRDKSKSDALKTSIAIHGYKVDRGTPCVWSKNSPLWKQREKEIVGWIKRDLEQKQAQYLGLLAEGKDSQAELDAFVKTFVVTDKSSAIQYMDKEKNLVKIVVPTYIPNSGIGRLSVLWDAYVSRMNGFTEEEVTYGPQEVDFTVPVHEEIFKSEIDRLNNQYQENALHRTGTTELTDKDHILHIAYRLNLGGTFTMSDAKRMFGNGTPAQRDYQIADLAWHWQGERSKLAQFPGEPDRPDLDIVNRFTNPKLKDTYIRSTKVNAKGSELTLLIDRSSPKALAARNERDRVNAEKEGKAFVAHKPLTASELEDWLAALHATDTPSNGPLSLSTWKTISEKNGISIVRAIADAHLTADKTFVDSLFPYTSTLNKVWALLRDGKEEALSHACDSITNGTQAGTTIVPPAKVA